ncbi:MAG: sigma 54-interacting transcriptional regulator [Acidobacteria bacterium]|nr:sigma 54-interacting transcriptional regulator [Acidobacteriota bacterium]
MAVGGQEDDILPLISAFPDLLELYPLDRFLGVLLRIMEHVAGEGPVGCYVPSSALLVARIEGRGGRESISKDVAATIWKGTGHETISTAKFGDGEAARLLQAHAEMRIISCPILERPVGFLIAPAGGREDPRLADLARLAGYYLHRHEIEQGLEAYGRQLVIIGRHPRMFHLQEEVERLARLNEPVLITGESGSGKEIFAMALHALSPRRTGPFVSVNCGAAPSENLLLDEFFGHRRGAFTGAILDKNGCCQEADGGTLFLDEVGDMSHELQTLLLRTLMTGEVRRLGDQRSTRVDIRLVSATHKDLLSASPSGHFRADLYYRLSVFRLHILPLRERQGDISDLATYILWFFAKRNGFPAKRLAGGAIAKLEAHPWHGNVRELENVLKRASVMANGDMIEASDLQFDHAERPALDRTEQIIFEVRSRGRTFWDAVYMPFKRRELTRTDVSLILEKAFESSGGQLSLLASYFNLSGDDYGRFVAFLHRHGFRPH